MLTWSPALATELWPLQMYPRQMSTCQMPWSDWPGTVQYGLAAFNRMVGTPQEGVNSRKHDHDQFSQSVIPDTASMDIWRLGFGP